MSDAQVFRLGIIICATIFVNGIIDRVNASTDNLSISGNYKNFEGVESYNLSVKNKHVQFNKFVSSSVFYEAVESNYSYMYTDAYKTIELLFFGRLSEHSKSLKKIEQTFSVGYQVNSYCALFVGFRSDAVGDSLLVRPSCEYKYNDIYGSFAYIRTDHNNILTAQIKYSITDMLYISYKYQLYDAFADDRFSWKASILAFGVDL
tara:strand:- start:9936 stop:10550 length:615 start_codon:yes stop_codon:yes gene_type:complete